MTTSAATSHARAAALAVPLWAWLAGLVAVSAAVRYALARQMPGPWIFVDEIIYSELGRSLAGSLALEVRGEPAGGYGVVYPLLISPAYLLFDSLPQAYAAVKAINALLVSLAAVPAYLLARRVLPPRLSLLAAVLALALPSLVYAGTVMTENAFYPVFLTVALLLVLTLERPTAWRQLALAAALVVAFETRAQAVALAAAALTAPLLAGFFARRVRATVWRHRLLYGIVLGGAVALAALQLARGRPLASLLGAYGVAGEAAYDVSGVARWLLYHVAELDLYVAAFPVAALVVLVALAPRLPANVQSYLAATVALSAWLTLVVAAFASRFALRVQERNLFYLVPLLLIALLVWIDRGAPRPRVAAGAAAVAAGLLPALLPFRTLIDVPARSDTLMLLPWWQAQDSLIALEHVVWAATACMLVAAALFLAVPRRYALVLPALLLVYFGLALRPIEAGPHGVRAASAGAVFQGIRHPQRDWIDRAVPEGAEVVVLRTASAEIEPVWQNEFFNRSVGRVVSLTEHNPGGLPQTQARLAHDGYVVAADGERVAAEYVLVDGSFAPGDDVVAADEGRGLFLYAVDGPLRSLTQVTGVHPDTWSGPEVVYRRVGCHGGSLSVRVRSDPGLFERPQTITATSGSRRVVELLPPRLERVVTVPLEAVDGVCTARFTVSPTAVPAEVTGGANPDRRELGAHFETFDYDPPA